jgi:hypothetical protein
VTTTLPPASDPDVSQSLPSVEAARQQAAGLSALMSLAPSVEPPAAAGLAPPAQPVLAASPVETGPDQAVAATAPAVAAPAAAARPARGFAVPLPLVVVLTVQVVLSARLLHANTAFGDEALYLWAGHLEWSHWLHGMRLPAFATWFSGSPVIYPPIGAIADSIGGLVAARILSLGFMLATTSLLWATTARLFDRRAAFFATGLFAAIGPTLHLGAFATYDPMALFLLALAAWFACGARTRVDSTGWILAAAVALARANATKYATAIFDPVVVAMAVLSAYPSPGGKAALRRGTLLVACLVGALAGLLRVGGSWYIAGITQTTTKRPNGGAPVARILLDSWQWTAVVLVVAAAGVILSIAARSSRPRVLLLAVLAGAALLVPADQAHVQTTVSLNKHVDFGAWFACIAAGYALSYLVSWLRWARAKAVVTACLGAALLPVASVGASQAAAMENWPGAGPLVSFLQPRTDHGGHFLAETDDVPEYYLPQTTWRQWSNTFSITLPNGKVRNAGGNPAIYAQAISRHYFSLVILSFSETAVMDQSILGALRKTDGYHRLRDVPYGGPVPGTYTIWAYTAPARRGAA